MSRAEIVSEDEREYRDMIKPRYSMKDAVEQLADYGISLTQDTIRNYERWGVIRPSRTAGKQRRFSDHDLWKIRRFRALMGLGIAREEACQTFWRVMDMSQREFLHLLAALEGRPHPRLPYPAENQAYELDGALVESWPVVEKACGGLFESLVNELMMLDRLILLLRTLPLTTTSPSDRRRAAADVLLESSHEMFRVVKTWVESLDRLSKESEGGNSFKRKGGPISLPWPPKREKRHVAVGAKK